MRNLIQIHTNGRVPITVWRTRERKKNTTLLAIKKAISGINLKNETETQTGLADSGVLVNAFGRKVH